MKKAERLCPICESINQPTVCLSCVNISVAEKQRLLKLSVQLRDKQKEKLEARLSIKDEGRVQRQLQEQHLAHRRALRERIEKATKLLAESKARVAEQEQWLRERQTLLEDASAQLSKKGKELFEDYYPGVLRAQSLGYATVSHELARGRRLVLRTLRFILPLKLAVVDVPSQWDGTKPLKQAVRICNARLPDGDDFTSIPATELSAALGYMLQFVSLSSRYLAAPILHSSGFAASSSRIWQRASYWNPMAPSPSAEVPLFLVRPGGGSSGSSSSSASESGVMWGTSGSFIARAADRTDNNAAHSPPVMANARGGLAHGVSRGLDSPMMSGSALAEASSPTPAGPGRGNNSEAIDSSMRKSLRRGMHLLHRSIACMCAHEFAHSGTAPAPQLPSFAVLSVLISQLLREPKSALWPSSSPELVGCAGGDPMSNSWSHGLGPEIEAVSGIGGPQPTHHLPSAVPHPLQRAGLTYAVECVEDFERDDGASENEEPSRETDCRESGFEEWDLVERPSLPPPPSRAEDVEHWTRAMFLDAR